MNKLLIGIIAVVFVLGGAGIFFARSQVSGQTLGSQTQVPTINGNVKEFTVTETNYAFNPATITVNKGDTAKINFVNSDGVHNFVIDEYSVSTNPIQAGNNDSVTFLADKAGSFTYYCSVDGHRELGMVGTLIVK